MLLLHSDLHKFFVTVMFKEVFRKFWKDINLTLNLGILWNSSPPKLTMSMLFIFMVAWLYYLWFVQYYRYLFSFFGHGILNIISWLSCLLHIWLPSLDLLCFVPFFVDASFSKAHARWAKLKLHGQHYLYLLIDILFHVYHKNLIILHFEGVILNYSTNWI